jgi:hypothetical protein
MLMKKIINRSSILTVFRSVACTQFLVCEQLSLMLWTSARQHVLGKSRGEKVLRKGICRRKGISHSYNRIPTYLIAFLLINFQGPARSDVFFGKIIVMTLLMHAKTGKYI